MKDEVFQTIHCRFCGDAQHPKIVFNTDQTKWRVAFPLDTCRPCSDDEHHFREVSQ